MATDTALVLLAKFTTLVSTDAQTTSYSTAPLDVSRYGAAQFQVWRGEAIGTSPTFKVFLEESLDGLSWTQPPGVGASIDPGKETLRLFSYAFRLRWFRLRVDFKGKYVTCWAEGLLR